MMEGMVFADRYKLVEFIGQGGMSLVYRAVDIRTGHSVAIKILKTEYNSDKEFLERFQREAQAASLMSHHNIVNLLDVGVEGEHRYLVLEYVKGSTLKDIIQRKGRLNTNTAISITIRILSALQHAHDNGIIHRDIKPQNVLVHADGHIKVADFGIARMTNAFTISKGDTVVGSVHYSSPEQATGSVVEATSDIYSTGVVLYEMLTGHVPFQGDTPVSVAMQHIKAPPPPIELDNPDVPPAVVAVVLKAMEKNPKKRYQSARDMADALIRARDGRAEPNTVTQAEPAKPNRSESAQASGNSASGRHPVHRKRSASTGWVVTMAMAGLVFTVLIIGVLQIWQDAVNRAVAPDLIGQTWEDGKKQLEREQLNWQLSEANHDTVPEGSVISQLPEPEATMKKNDTVFVTISKGPQQVEMPEIVGLLTEEAQQKLKEKGLSLSGYKTVSDEPINTVLTQNPEKGSPCKAGQEVQVTISGGSTTVPEVTEMTYEKAIEKLAEASLAGGKIEYIEVTDENEAGIVKAQSPVAGTLAVLQAQVTLSVTRMGKPYHGQYTFTVPKSLSGLNVRVTLMEGDTEVEQYSATLVAGEEQQLTVELSSNLSGPQICRVYLDEMLAGEQEVPLQ